MRRIHSGSRPGSRSVPRSASTSEPRQGCDVLPESASIAASIASTPLSTAASTVAADRPDVSCVWKWIGRSVASRSALNSTRAAAGFSSPAMSLTAMIWAPACSSSLASAT